jgi:hypothetical protein
MKSTVLIPNSNRVRHLRGAQIYVDSVNHAAPHASKALEYGFRLRVGRRVMPWEKCFDTSPTSAGAMTRAYMDVLSAALYVLSDWQDDKPWSIQIVTAEPRIVEALRDQVHRLLESGQRELDHIFKIKPSVMVGMLLAGFHKAAVLVIDEEDRESFRAGNGLRLL